MNLKVRSGKWEMNEKKIKKKKGKDMDDFRYGMVESLLYIKGTE